MVTHSAKLGMMKIRCAKCRKIIGTKPGREGAVSDTFCQDCFKLYYPEIYAMWEEEGTLDSNLG